MAAPTVTLFLRVSPELKERIEAATWDPEYPDSSWRRRTIQQTAVAALAKAFPPIAAPAKLTSKARKARR